MHPAAGAGAGSRRLSGGRGSCTFWRLGFRQSGFRHITRISRHAAPYASATAAGFLACYCPRSFLSDHGSAIRSKDTSSSPCPLCGLYSSAPRGAHRTASYGQAMATRRSAAPVGGMFTLSKCSSPSVIVGSWPRVRSAPSSVDVANNRPLSDGSATGFVSGNRMAASAASSYVCLVDDAAESFVVGVVVAPDDVPADHAGLLLVAGVVGAVQREVPQRRELRLDAV